MRYKLTIEYDGAPYQGWQRLPGAPSVQGALEDAVEKLIGSRTDVIGAGRTDSGVHATGQVAHVDMEKPFDAFKLSEAINAHIRPQPISVVHAEIASPDFHARFDAVRRHYVYTIVNRRAPLALERGRAWRIGLELDIDAMNRAAATLIGKHDFTTFRDGRCQAKSPIKTLDFANAKRSGDRVEFSFVAQSFLHRQVRSMVGTLVEVGLGKMTADEVAGALAAKDRAQCGPVSPPDGLCLIRVDY